MGTVAEHPLLKRHLWMIQALGPAGMSSDEEEHDGVNLVYRRVKQPWRRTDLVEWFRIIDIFVKAGHFTPEGASTPGAHPHMRNEIPKSNSKRKAVYMLPKDTYDQLWFKGLHDYDRDKVSPSDKPYVFIHEDAVYKYVCHEQKRAQVG